jgi:hypothetical protein
MKEREFYLMRLYLRPGCWRLTFFEVNNFDNGDNWSFAAVEFNYPTKKPSNEGEEGRKL